MAEALSLQEKVNGGVSHHPEPDLPPSHSREQVSSKETLYTWQVFLITPPLFPSSLPNIMGNPEKCLSPTGQRLQKGRVSIQGTSDHRALHELIFPRVLS